MSERSSTYIHGTEPHEQQRLARMNALLNEHAMAELQLSGGERILDLGSGLGQYTRDMARAAGASGKVIGIERSAEQLETALRLAREHGEADRVEFRLGDALDPPLRREEWGSFDLVHTRYLLEHVPDALAVVRIMARAVRPGGRVVLEDDDHEMMCLWPALPAFDVLWRAYWDSYRSVGNDPLVGRKLVGLLHQAGLAPRRNHWLFFGSCAGAPDWREVIDNLVGVVRTARVQLQVSDPGTARDMEPVLQQFVAWSERPDAALWYPICWAEGVKAC